jgi:hypothetical protein
MRHIMVPLCRGVAAAWAPVSAVEQPGMTATLGCHQNAEHGTHGMQLMLPYGSTAAAKLPLDLLMSCDSAGYCRMESFAVMFVLYILRLLPQLQENQHDLAADVIKPLHTLVTSV